MQIKLNTLFSGFDFKSCWVAPILSATADNSLQVLSMGKLNLSGSDVFEGSYCAYSKDHGNSWTQPEKTDQFSLRPNNFGGKSCCEIFTKYHKKTNQILGFGHIVNYTSENKVDHVHPRAVTLTVLNQQTLEWSPLIEINIPEQINKGLAQLAFQTFELDNGDILVPVAVSALSDMLCSIYVTKIRIDENKAHIIEYGKEVNQVKQPRGLCEPSLIKFQDRFFMTMRNDITGYFTSSNDGLSYNDPKPWCFDNGELLGNYNTQQRWVRNGNDELYLIYTRKNVDNDNIFRHRGPVMIAQVDTEKLCIIRETERILIPNRGARMGNFMVTEISSRHSWFTVAEWMQNDDKGYGRLGAEYCASFGSDNSVFLADIKW